LLINRLSSGSIVVYCNTIILIWAPHCKNALHNPTRATFYGG